MDQVTTECNERQENSGKKTRKSLARRHRLGLLSGRMRARAHLLLFGAAIILGAGCAAQKPSWFMFGDTSEGDWQSRVDFVGIAKRYALTQGIKFQFERSHSHLLIFGHGDAVFARVTFDSGPGSYFYEVDIDSSGRVVRDHPVRVSNE